MTMYEDLSANYDRFIDWPARLASELPFIERQLEAAGVRRLLDAACGTGHHAIALAQRGYTVVGADGSPGMIEEARALATASELELTFAVAPFSAIRPAVEGPFDALLCLGNSLPHVLTHSALEPTLADFAACLRPGGLLLVQTRNFDKVMAQKQRWMPPKADQEDESEWIFFRFYDFVSEERIRFNMVTLHRPEGAEWGSRVSSTSLRPWRHSELLPALEKAGFGRIDSRGDMKGNPFEPTSSPNLVLLARRA